MASIVVSGDTSGAITLQAPNVAGSTTLTLPTITSTLAFNGAAFSAYASTSQSVTVNTNTKVTLDTEQFDTNNNFSSSRFTPNIAGYYQINGIVRGNATSMTAVVAMIYKNGTNYSASQVAVTSTPFAEQVVVSDVVYLNGSTDYVELYGAVYASSGATFNATDAAFTSKLSGCLIRAA